MLNGIVGAPSVFSRSISMISDQRADTASGSSHWISAAVMAETTSVRMALLPVRTGRAPRAVRILAAGLLVDLQERPAGVARVQLHVREAVVVELADDADAELVDPGPASGVVVGLGDDHVATVAAAPLEVALGGDALDDRGDDLQQLGADRHQRVVQPDAADVRVLVADGEAEDGDEVVDDGVAVLGDEGDLAQSQHGGQLPWNRGVRFSTNAEKASLQSAEAVIVPWAFVSRATNSPKPIDSAAT